MPQALIQAIVSANSTRKTLCTRGGTARKGHHQELIHAGEILDLVIASVSGHASTKSAQWQKRHELRENKLAVVHESPLRADAKDHKSWNRSSNRDQTKIVQNQGKSLTYDDLM